MFSSHTVFVHVAWYTQSFSLGVESAENPITNTFSKPRSFETDRFLTTNTILSTTVPFASFNLSQSIDCPLWDAPAPLLYSFRKRKNRFYLWLQPTQPC